MQIIPRRQIPRFKELKNKQLLSSANNGIIKHYKKALIDIKKEIKSLYDDLGLNLLSPSAIKKLLKSREGFSIVYLIDKEQKIRRILREALEKANITIRSNILKAYKESIMLNNWLAHIQTGYRFIPVLPTKTLHAIQRASYIQRINFRTKAVWSVLKRKIIEGVNEVGAEKELSKLLGFRDKAGKILRGTNLKGEIYKSKRIFRTEAGRFNSIADVEVAEGLKKEGLNTVFVWLASMDGDTRDSHAYMNGKKSGLDFKFDWAGGRYYQKQSGIKHEDINCRCTTFQEVVDVSKKFQKKYQKIEPTSYQTYKKKMSAWMETEEGQYHLKLQEKTRQIRTDKTIPYRIRKKRVKVA